MNNKNPKKILAIDPGTKYVGFAFLEGKELIHYGVKTIQKKHGILQQGQKAVLRLITDFHPQILAVEKTYFGNNRDSETLNRLTRKIRVIGKQQGLSVMSIATNSVRKVICDNGAASKDDVARAIVLRFPELKPYLTSNTRWKERYYRNLFDAIALGLVSDWSNEKNSLS